MAKQSKGICPICGMKNCKCDHTTKAVPALMGDPRPHRKPASVFKDAVGNRDGSSIAAEGMSAANYSMHKRGAKMRKSGGGGDYVEPKYEIENGGGKGGKGGYAGQPNAGVPPMYPKGNTYAPPPRSPFKPDGGTAGGKKPSGMNPIAPTPSSKLPPRAPSPEPKKKTTKMAKSAKKVSKAMPMPMTSAMPSIPPRPMPPKMPPPAPSMMRPVRPATMHPALSSSSGLAPMTKGKKVSKAATMQDRVKREVSALNDFIVGTNYRGIPSTGSTVMRESGAGTPGWKVKYTDSPVGKPGSYPGTKGAKKMAKGESDEIIPRLRERLNNEANLAWQDAQPKIQASSGTGAVWTQKPGYAVINSFADTEGQKDYKLVTYRPPVIRGHTVQPPKPGSTSGGRGAGTRKMAKKDGTNSSGGKGSEPYGPPTAWDSFKDNAGRAANALTTPVKNYLNNREAQFDAINNKTKPKPDPKTLGEHISSFGDGMTAFYVGAPVKAGKKIVQTANAVWDAMKAPPKNPKMKKADGQGAFINGKPAPQSHSLSKIAKSASSGQGAYINGRPAQTTKRSK